MLWDACCKMRAMGCLQWDACCGIQSNSLTASTPPQASHSTYSIARILQQAKQIYQKVHLVAPSSSPWRSRSLGVAAHERMTRIRLRWLIRAFIIILVGAPPRMAPLTRARRQIGVKSAPELTLTSYAPSTGSRMFSPDLGNGVGWNMMGCDGSVMGVEED